MLKAKCENRLCAKKIGQRDFFCHYCWCLIPWELKRQIKEEQKINQIHRLNDSLDIAERAIVLKWEMLGVGPVLPAWAGVKVERELRLI